MVDSSEKRESLRISLSAPTIYVSPDSPMPALFCITVLMRSIGIWKANTPRGRPFASSIFVAMKLAGAP